MQRSPQAKRAPLPLAPMVNIVFLLLAVFIIGGVLRQKEPWPVLLPQSDVGGARVSHSAREVAVLLDGEHVAVDGGVVPWPRLAAALAARLEASGGHALLVAAADADTGAFLRLMALLRTVGYLRVELLLRRAAADS